VAALQGRTVVFDIGSNLGFFSALAVSRGYDVVSIEASREAAVRAALNVEAAGATLGGAGKVPSGDVVRKPVAWVFNNAAADGRHRMDLHFVSDNVGASWVTMGSDGGGGTVDGTTTVASMAVDDLIAPAEGGKSALRSNSGGRASSALPTIDASTVALIKMSAEGTDARALEGMRGLLSAGRVPFLVFVYNAGHVKGAGCEGADLIYALVEAGYRLYAHGVYFGRRRELEMFVEANTGRSMELVFVRADIEFW
jgi:hypothetical protein